MQKVNKYPFKRFVILIRFHLVAKTEEESKVEEVVEQPAEKVEEVVKEKDPEDDIKDAWDASSDEEESEETAPTSGKNSIVMLSVKTTFFVVFRK